MEVVALFDGPKALARTNADNSTDKERKSEGLWI